METLQTIKLLDFDGTSHTAKPSTQDWRTIGTDLELGLASPISGNLADYIYWRDRLRTLEETYQKAIPTTMKQWWHDRRNPTQWLTYWQVWLAIAAILFTLFFGLVQSVTGIIQAYATYHVQPCVKSS